MESVGPRRAAWFAAALLCGSAGAVAQPRVHVAGSATVQLGADVAIGPAIGKHQDHLRSPRILEPSGPGAHPTFQFLSFRRCNEHSSVSHAIDTEASATCFMLTSHSRAVRQSASVIASGQPVSSAAPIAPGNDRPTLPGESSVAPTLRSAQTARHRGLPHAAGPPLRYLLCGRRPPSSSSPSSCRHSTRLFQ
jgi:hypothetical protein